ncbi:probable methyltransferase At1g29790 [Rosa chinensis]|uniref:probable methyltransferase At1g29790 n=1 Tax=Rosa chinensis TaxID=74649 RepID=UPI001AD8D3B5|nr:probable methyltransferase At1g29790 [Rosa chinensis]
MQKEGASKQFKCLLSTMLCAILLVSPLTVFIFGFNSSYPKCIFATNSNISLSHGLIALPDSLRSEISRLQIKLGFLLEQLHDETSESKVIAKFSEQVLYIAISLDKIAVSLSESSKNSPSANNEVSNVDEDFSDPEEGEAEEQFMSGNVFKSGEIRSYISPKPNRLVGKKNFLGVDALTPSIGLACAKMASNLDRFMSYKVHSACPDDSQIAQKLIVHGCDPLPRRRCFTKSPPHYTKPFPINASLWTQPSDANILWNNYKCKDYSCLVSKETADRRGFFKCSSCFNISQHGWNVPTNESVSAEFTIDEVLSLKPGEIRIGLDYSPTTGNFAAVMREKNVTIASSTLNLGIELLQFVLFDWDRVLRPKGLLWIDRFFCHKEDMKLYLEEFNRLGYKPLLWRVVPKNDKLGDELFFSAVLEKPIRG